MPESDYERVMVREWSLFLATDLYPPFAAQYYLQWAGIDASESVARRLHRHHECPLQTSR